MGRLVEIDEERAKLEPELAESPDLVRQARVEALRSAPTQATDGVGTEVRRLIEKEEKGKRRLAALLAEREAVVQVEAEEAEKQRQALTRQLVGRGTVIRERELAAWAEAGQAFAALVGIFEDAIRTPALELEELRDEARRAGIDPDTLAELAPPVRPFPVDAWAFLGLLWAAAADPGGLGRREVGASHAQRSDVEWRLPGLVPDLRPVARVSLRSVESGEAVFGR